MSKDKEETGISVLTGQGADSLKVSKDDVVAIFVSDYEDALDSELISKNEEVKNLDKAMQLKSKEIQSFLKKEFDSVTDEFKKKVSNSLELCGLNTEKLMLNYNITGSKATAQVFIQNQTSNESVSIVKIFDSTSSEVTKLQDDLSALRDSRAAAGDRIRGIKQELGNISKQERKVRAAIARSSLEKTDEGKKLLNDVAKNKGKTKALTVKE